MQDTVEAQRLVSEQKQRPFADCELWGPISYDLILSKGGREAQELRLPLVRRRLRRHHRPRPVHGQHPGQELAHPRPCCHLRRGRRREGAIALTSRSANEEETYLSLVFCAVLDAWRKSSAARAETQTKPAGPFPPGGSLFSRARLTIFLAVFIMIEYGYLSLEVIYEGIWS